MNSIINCNQNINILKSAPFEIKHNSDAIQFYATNSVAFRSIHNRQSVLENIIKCIKKENLIGEGRNSKVYKYTDNLVIKVLKSNSTNKIIVNELPEYNLGQAIHKVQDNIYILRKLEGFQHGFEDWVKVTKMLSIPQEKAQKFAKQIHKISKMPNETFDEFAKITKYIGDNGYKNDSINPNNLLIDYDKQQINIIDYIKTNPNLQLKNCYLDMVCNILDYINFEKIYRALPKEEQKSFIEDANVIIKRCYNSAQKEGLSTDKSSFEEFISFVGNVFNIGSLMENYTTFVNLVSL